jgi:hypothetical protein
VTLEEAQTQADKALADRAYALRSCFECNPCHEHLHSDPPILFLCIGDCGSWWFGTWNLTEERKMRKAAS